MSRPAVVIGALAAIGAGVWASGVRGDTTQRRSVRRPVSAAASPTQAAADPSTLVVRASYSDRRNRGLIGAAYVRPLGLSFGPEEPLSVEDVPGGFIARVKLHPPDEGWKLGTSRLVSIEPKPRGGIEQFDTVLAVVDAARGELDLGVLPPRGGAPVAVAGLVVDAEGAPISGAHVAVAVTIGEITFSAFTPDLTTNADGAFEWRANLRGVDSIRVSPTAGWSGEPTAEARPGTRGLRLRADRVFTRSGTIAVPQGTPLAGLVVEISGEGLGSTRGATARADWVEFESGLIRFPASGGFDLERFPPGSYDVVLRRAGAKSAIAERRNWRPENGDVPPLEPVGSLHTVKLRALRHDGVPATYADVWLCGGGPFDEYGQALKTDDQGRLAFATTDLSGRIAVKEDGCRLEFSEVSGSEVTLQLRPALTAHVTLRLPEGISNPAPGETRSIGLNWTGDPDSPAPQRRPRTSDPRARVQCCAPVDSNGAASILVETPGWYVPVARVKVAGNGLNFSSVERSVEGAEPILVDGSGAPVPQQLSAAWKRAFERDATSPPK